MWTCRSHLLSYLKSKFWLKIKDMQLVGIDELITKKMDKHTKKKALAFSTDEVEQFLRTGPMTESGKCNKLIMLFSIFSLGHMEELSVLKWEDIKCNTENNSYNYLHHCKTRGKDFKDQHFFLPYTVYGIDVKQMVEELRGSTGGKGHVWRCNQSTERLGKLSVAKVTQKAAALLKLDNLKLYTGHGLRATRAMWMADHGATELELMQAGNWKNPAIARDSSCLFPEMFYFFMVIS
eukprot:m51a1_g8290 hypothetical protein (236) ;mRNA; f:142792-145581